MGDTILPNDFMPRVRAAIVDALDRIVPKPLLRLALHPKLHSFIGLDRIDAVSIWIDNNFMLKRRQKKTQDQHIDEAARAVQRSQLCAGASHFV